MTAIVGIVSFVLGMYAGRRRARGLGWGDIWEDCCRDACTLASKMLSAVSAPFRKKTTERESPSDADNG